MSWRLLVELSLVLLLLQLLLLLLPLVLFLLLLLLLQLLLLLLQLLLLLLELLLLLQLLISCFLFHRFDFCSELLVFAACLGGFLLHEFLECLGPELVLSGTVELLSSAGLLEGAKGLPLQLRCALRFLLPPLLLAGLFQLSERARNFLRDTLCECVFELLCSALVVRRDPGRFNLGVDDGLCLLGCLCLLRDLGCSLFSLLGRCCCCGGGGGGGGGGLGLLLSLLGVQDLLGCSHGLRDLVAQRESDRGNRCGSGGGAGRQGERVTSCGRGCNRWQRECITEHGGSLSLVSLVDLHPEFVVYGLHFLLVFLAHPECLLLGAEALGLQVVVLEPERLDARQQLRAAHTDHGRRGHGTRNIGERQPPGSRNVTARR